jgi:hypothetical protein
MRVLPWTGHTARARVFFGTFGITQASDIKQICAALAPLPGALPADCKSPAMAT